MRHVELSQERNRLRASGNIVFLCGVIVMFVGAGCQNNDQGKSMAARMAGMAVNVAAVKAKKQTIEDKISLVGTMAANESVEIKSEIDGVIEELNFTEGQKVTKGQVLLAIDKRKLEASLAQAQASLKLAQTTGKRYQTLIESQAISKQEFDQSRADLEAAQAAVDLVQAEFDDAIIEAPFDGIMGERKVSQGQFITKGVSIAFLINQNPLKAQFRVPEKYLGQLKEKQVIEISVAAYPAEIFKGEVYFIDPQIDEATRTALVKAVVPNADGRLRVGMFANLDLIINAKTDAVVIPETALIAKDEDVNVFVVDAEGKAQPRPIKVGIRMAGFVEVVSGLQDGELVITEGFQKIGPGSKVNVRDPNQPQEGTHNNAPETSSSNKSVPAKDSSEK